MTPEEKAAFLEVTGATKGLKRTQEEVGRGKKIPAKEALVKLAKKHKITLSENDLKKTVNDLEGHMVREIVAKKQTGTGLKNPSRRAYTLDGDRFGNLVVDLPKLFATGRTVDGKRKFVAYKDGHKVLTISPVDDTLVDLLTKRYDPKVAYTDAARDAFRQIVALSDLPVAKHDKPAA